MAQFKPVGIDANSLFPPRVETRLAKQFRPGDEHVYSALKNGLTCDGVTDDSAALIALLKKITDAAVMATIVFPIGASVNLGAKAINVDLSFAALVGDRTFFLGGTLNLYCSSDYYANQRAWLDVIRGITFRNSNLNIGHATYDTVGKFRISDGGMMGGTLTFLSNAWKIAFSLFHNQGTAIKLGSGVTNTGENMIFRDCMMGDGSTITLSTGDWVFDGCSFDNMAMTFSGDAVVNLNSCHYEHNGGESKRIISVSGTAAVVIRGGVLVLDPGSGDWTMAPFFVDPGTKNGGLFVNGLSLPRQPYFKPENQDGLRILTAGGGSAHFRDISTWEEGGATAYSLSESDNRLRNGGSEEGNSSGWTLPSGGWVLDTGTKNKGTSSHKLQVAAGGTGPTMYQDVAVESGRAIWMSLWQAYNGAAGSSLNTQIDFYDRAGSKVGTYGYDQLTVATTRHLGRMTQVPVGAAVARLTFYLAPPTSGTAMVNLDSMIINVT
jgi:hypothetical protein